MAKRDYYDILGLSKSAAADEIKSAYRKLARKLHPDATKNDPKSTEKFKEVQEAYDVLSDSTKRSNYDQFGHAGVGSGSSGGAGVDPFEAFRRAQQSRGAGNRRWNGGPGVSVEDFDVGQGGGDYGSIFDQLFGSRAGAGAGAARSRGRAKQSPPRGQDIETPVALTFEQAARGTNLPLQINRDGKTETIEVKVPPGVWAGSRVRIKGLGEHTGGEPGDLYIVTTVHPHPYFRREGVDVLIDLPLSLYEALLGAKVDVPTLDGKVTMTIPPGTTGGAKLRVKGKGIHRGSEQGDQYVIVKIILPKSLDDSDKDLIQKLAAKHPIDPRPDFPWK